MTELRAGPQNAITDVEGIEVGHVTRRDPPYLTGTTVVLPSAGAVAGVDIRGGGPGTRETDALDPRGLVARIHAVVLTGGSAYGLEAASGAALELETRGVGLPVGPEPHEIVPIVPAAVLFDLGRGGDFSCRPDAGFGRAAVAGARGGAVEQGCVGAGTGAVAGALKGGVGTASVVLPGGGVVAALVVLNCAGSAVDPRSGLPYGLFTELEGEFGGLEQPSPEDVASGAGLLARSLAPPLNTTIGVVATDARLSRAQAQKLAGGGQAGMARAIRPVHTLFDGDAVFGLATAVRELEGGSGDFARAVALNTLYAAAADVFTRAVVHALLAAESLGDWPCYRDAYPSALED